MQTKKIQKLLLDWYDRNKRDLPWRRARDPYAVWVSEIMLQQTQVDTVIPYFERWMKLFPTVETLASAEENAVLKAWEGLGYYSRARNLRRAAQIVAREHGGRLPAAPEKLSALPGIGPYTLGAVSSIAFGLPVPAVDGNVLRVFSRLFAIEKNVREKETVAAIRNHVAALFPEKRRGDMTQAWMELGALVCLPAAPKCPACPLAALCGARIQNLVEKLPVANKRPPTRKIETAALVLRRNGAALLERKPEGEIMGGLWLFPTVELGAAGKTERELFEKRLGFPLRGALTQRLTLSHSYTVYRATLRVFESATVEKPKKIPERMKWIAVEELAQTPLPSAHAKIARALFFADKNEGGGKVAQHKLHAHR